MLFQFGTLVRIENILQHQWVNIEMLALSTQ